MERCTRCSRQGQAGAASVGSMPARHQASPYQRKKENSIGLAVAGRDKLELLLSMGASRWEASADIRRSPPPSRRPHQPSRCPRAGCRGRCCSQRSQSGASSAASPARRRTAAAPSLAAEPATTSGRHLLLYNPFVRAVLLSRTAKMVTCSWLACIEITLHRIDADRQAPHLALEVGDARQQLLSHLAVADRPLQQR